MKKSIVKILSVSLAVSLFLCSGPNVFADDVKSYTPDEIVKLSEEHDLTKQIQDFENSMKNVRQAYLPTTINIFQNGLASALSGSPFSSMAGMPNPYVNIFTMSIYPKLMDSKNKVDDYNKLNTNLTTELGTYKNIYLYWYAREAVSVTKTNLNQAQDELNQAKLKFDKGSMSGTDYLQFQMAYNKALSTYNDTESKFEQVVYKMNNIIGQDVGEGMEVDTPEFSFMDDSDIDINTVLPRILIVHKALLPLNTALANYEAIINLLSNEDDAILRSPSKSELIKYYNQEVYGVNLRLTQAKNNLELATYVYVRRLNSLKDDINTEEKNLDIANDMYKKYLSMYNYGAITAPDLEKARLNIMNTNLELINSKKDYMIAKQEYQLFNQGYTPSVSGSVQDSSSSEN